MESFDVFVSIVVVVVVVYVFVTVYNSFSSEVDTMMERGRVACSECEGIYSNCVDDSMTYSCVVQYRERHNLTEEEYPYSLETRS